LRFLVLRYDASSDLVYFVQISKLPFVVVFGSLRPEHGSAGWGNWY
jgi:hypothetical protein